MPSGVSYTVSLLLYLYLPLAPQGNFTLLSLLLLPSPPRPARHLYSLLFTLISLLSHPPLAPQGIFPLLSYIFYLPYDRIWY